MVFAACHSDGGQLPGVDASPDGPPIDGDGQPSALGMSITWHADPSLPGTISDKITVTDATFQMDHLQILGDAGVDARTTHSKYLLSWDAQGKPAQERFPDAPVGVYSKILVVMMTGALGANAYEIHGTWMDSNAQPIRFEIRDRLTLSLAIDCDEELPAAGSATLGVKLDLKDALNSIKFEDLEPEEGQLELNDGPQLIQFRDRLKKAFKLGDD